MENYDYYAPEALASYVTKTQAALEAHKTDFDSIVVRGVSGLIVGSIVAHAMSKPIVIVRKPGVSSHASVLVSNFMEIGERYVIVDDFVSLGNTKRAIREAIRDETRAWSASPKFMGLFQYLNDSWNDAAWDVEPEPEVVEAPMVEWSFWPTPIPWSLTAVV